MNKLYKTFFPTEEDLQRFKEEAEKLDKEAREHKHCVVCSHYTYDASVPGFVTYEGDCDMGHVAFFGDYPDGPCPDWNGKVRRNTSSTSQELLDKEEGND